MVLKQIAGTLRNIRGLVSGATLQGILPPSIYSTLVWVANTLPRSLGFGSRTQHITGVVAFTLVLIIASLTILTAVAIAFFLVAMPIALLRLVPAVEKRWPLSGAAWPLWEVP